MPLSAPSTSLPVRASEVELTTRLDEASATVTYVGKAALGSLESDAVWQIQRITVSGSVTDIKWANSNDLYENVWNNRASLTYG